jgi:Toprim domain
MSGPVSELAGRLAEEAEAVCRRYLSNGRRLGNYWLVGDINNTSGRSLYVRLKGDSCGRTRVGKWIDAATGEHGDLLDVIRIRCGLSAFSDVLDEARRFLNSPRYDFLSTPNARTSLSLTGSAESARRLFHLSRPIAGTLAEAYLRSRGITAFHEDEALRFHPRCYYRTDQNAPTQTFPALIAAVTDASNSIVGVQRTWLDSTGQDKAPIETPRRAVGRLRGHGVRFGFVNDVMAAGEGVETMLSLRCALTQLPTIAALSASNLAGLALPSTLRRLYIARDDDAAGDDASDQLAQRAATTGVEVLVLSPMLADFNDDLRYRGIVEIRAALRIQLAPDDVVRFMPPRAICGAGK